jgi:thiosulfate/3-mercaptopyruvate sulfurtransferase
VSEPLVSAAWLRERLGDPGLVVVDCRYRLGEPGAGEELWREAHIPGAAFMDVDRDLAAESGERGRHPLPEPEDFEAAARRAGIGPDTLVIAYDEAAEGGAARLWWLLRHFGHDRVSVLDGGLRGSALGG